MASLIPTHSTGRSTITTLAPLYVRLAIILHNYSGGCAFLRLLMMMIHPRFLPYLSVCPIYPQQISLCAFDVNEGPSE